MAPGGHHLAPAKIVLGAPVEILKHEGQIVFPGNFLEHALGLRDDFRTDAITGDYRNRKGLHEALNSIVER